MQALVEQVSQKLQSLGYTLVTAESCTGGLIAAAMTDKAGSSKVFERGFITYSNESKIELLDIPKKILKDEGAVSAKTAQAMVKGALKNSKADIALSVTGVAGPDGGTANKPVGLVYIGYGLKGEDVIHSSEHRFAGDRVTVRKQAAEMALIHLLRFLKTVA